VQYFFYIGSPDGAAIMQCDRLNTIVPMFTVIGIFPQFNPKFNGVFPELVDV